MIVTGILSIVLVVTTLACCASSDSSSPPPSTTSTTPTRSSNPPSRELPTIPTLPPSQPNPTNLEYELPATSNNATVYAESIPNAKTIAAMQSVYEYASYERVIETPDDFQVPTPASDEYDEQANKPPWVHGKMTNETAESFLKSPSCSPCTPGAFLVRQRDTVRAFTISRIKEDNTVAHGILTKTNKGWVYDTLLFAKPGHTWDDLLVILNCSELKLSLKFPVRCEVSYVEPDKEDQSEQPANYEAPSVTHEPLYGLPSYNENKEDIYCELILPDYQEEDSTTDSTYSPEQPEPYLERDDSSYMSIGELQQNEAFQQYQKTKLETMQSSEPSAPPSPPPGYTEFDNNAPSKPKHNPISKGMVLPSFIERKQGENGRTYYLNHITKESFWDIPVPLAGSYVPLPPGWEFRPYPRPHFVDHFARASYHMDPRPLPEHWDQRVNRDGVAYFVNHETKVSQWHHPCARERVEAQTSLDGRTYFVDHLKKTTSWEDPRLEPWFWDVELPAGWERKMRADWKVFYLNHNDKTSHWTLPGQ
eukprot:m.54311 g.54311  ORF g.54311 m.54311 type:complete len:535 (+) comp18502_c0_seq1:140-1744(+)